MTNTRTRETIDKFEKVIVRLGEYNYREAKLRAKVRDAQLAYTFGHTSAWFKTAEAAAYALAGGFNGTHHDLIAIGSDNLSERNND